MDDSNDLISDSEPQNSGAGTTVIRVTGGGEVFNNTDIPNIDDEEEEEDLNSISHRRTLQTEVRGHFVRQNN